MTRNDRDSEPLAADPQRSAAAAIRGYVYQVACTALAWTQLEPEEIIYLEQAEDFDRRGRIDEAVQVKVHARPITLRSRPSQEVIVNCWRTRRANPNRKVHYRLLTTAEPTTETGDPFGGPGILLWNRTGEAAYSEATARDTRLLIAFLLDALEIPEDMVRFLREASDDAVHLEIIAPVTFDVGADPIPDVEVRIEERLALVSMQAGIFLSNTRNSLNGVLRAVWTTLIKDSDRVLTRGLLMVTLEETNRAVAHRGEDADAERMRELRSLLSALVGSVVLPAETAPGAPGFIRSRIFQELPPLPRLHHRRADIFSRAEQLLNDHHAVAICGPRYAGKSTAAIDVAGSRRGHWAWIDLLDENANAVAQQALSELKAKSHVLDGVVIDGFAHTDASVAARIGSILAHCTVHGIDLVFAPNGELSPLTLQRMGIDDRLVLHLQPFTLAEVEAFLAQLDCPPALTRTWAAIVELTTVGSPLFIAARLSRLQRENFPPPSANDISAVPAEIEQLRRDVRLIAANDLDSAQSELLNRLSIAFDAYRRDVAIQLGQVAPAVESPGNALDALVGVWVQELDSRRYRIFPIALNFGREAHGVDWANHMHVAAATAILNASVVTTDEVADALQHAFIGENNAIAHNILLPLSLVDEEIFAAFSRSAAWLPYTFVGEAQRPEFLSRNARALLRLNQIRMSILSDEGLSQPLMGTFDEEYPQLDDDEFVRRTRFLGLSELLLRGRVSSLSFSQIVDYSAEWAQLIPEFLPRSALEQLSETINERFPAETTPTSAPLQSIGFMALSAIGSASDLNNFVTEIAEQGGAFASTFLRSVNCDPPIAAGLILGIWAKYMTGERADWEDGIAQFAEAAGLLFDVGLNTLADEAAAAAVRLAAERNEEIHAAVELEDRLRSRFDKQRMPSLERAKARVLMLAQQYADAVGVWVDALRSTSWDGTDFNLYGDYRDAAISFARLERWDCSAEMLLECASRLSEAALPLWKAALEFDAAYVLWRSRMYTLAVAPVLRGARILAAIEIDQASDADFMVLKRVGHTISYISDPRAQRDKGFESPPVACASWLDTSRPPIAMKPTSVDLILAVASKYAFLYGTDTDASMFESRSLASSDLLARAEGLFVAIFRAASIGAATGFVTLLGSVDQLIEEVAGSREDTPSQQDRSPAFLLVAGTFVLGTTNGLTADLLRRWREEAEMAGLADHLIDVLSEIETLFVSASVDADQVFRASGNWLLKTLASIKVASALGNFPERWLRVHWVWIQFAAAMPFSELAGGLISGLISERWEALSRHPIRLSRPAITVPRLQSAIRLEAPVWTKIAAVLDAAADAAGVNTPDFIREIFERKVEDGR